MACAPVGRLTAADEIRAIEGIDKTDASESGAVLVREGCEFTVSFVVEVSRIDRNRDGRRSSVSTGDRDGARAREVERALAAARPNITEANGLWVDRERAAA